jgi:ABC-type Fe3+/spermidine/putrescine transport system ATPase subunit
MSIIVKNISYSLKKNLLIKDLSFEIKNSTFGVIEGASGVGKTTLLNFIAGLKKPQSGEIILNNKILSSDSEFVLPEERNIGYVFQDFALFPHINVKKNILFASKNKDSDFYLKIIEILKLESHLQKMPHELSGGLMQRVAICRTLMMKPSLLILDEPFSNLDYENSVNIKKILNDYILEKKIPCLIVSHDTNLFNEIDKSNRIKLD